MKPAPLKDLPVGIGIFLVPLLLVVLIILTKNGRRSTPPPRCPIDGIAAEWQTRPHAANMCNYGHFSAAEQKPHTWWAACW
jgi:hypothetical protein